MKKIKLFSLTLFYFFTIQFIIIVSPLKIYGAPYYEDVNGERIFPSTSTTKTTPNTSKSFYRDDGTLYCIEEYDKVTGNLIKHTRYRQDGQTIERINLYERSTGKLIQATFYRADGITIKEIDEFNKDTSQVVKAIRYNSDGKTVDYIYEYDKNNGRKIKEIHYFPNGKTINYITEFGPTTGNYFRTLFPIRNIYEYYVDNKDQINSILKNQNIKRENYYIDDKPSFNGLKGAINWYIKEPPKDLVGVYIIRRPGQWIEPGFYKYTLDDLKSMNDKFSDIYIFYKTYEYAELFPNFRHFLKFLNYLFLTELCIF